MTSDKEPAARSRYSAGVMEYQQDGLLAAGLCVRATRTSSPVPRHAAGRRRSDRSGGGGRRRNLDRDLDSGVDRPVDRMREIPRQVPTASIRCRMSQDQYFAYIAYDLDLFEPGSIANLVGLDHRQCVRLQAAEGACVSRTCVSRSPM